MEILRLIGGKRRATPRRRSILRALVASTLLFAGTAPAQALNDAPPRPAVHALTAGDLDAWLDGYVPYALKRSDIAGAVIVVVKDGQVLFEKGYGYADLATHRPMDPRLTVVDVASVSKTFTWTAVMQLVEQHKLDLDRNVNDYLDFKVPDAFGKPITLRNLMTHTAGFQEVLKQYNRPGDAPRSLGPYMHRVPPPTRIFAPGEVPAYSNYGTNLAGYIVERVSGEPFDQYVEHHILHPLAMTRSSFHRPLAAPLQSAMAKNYSTASDGSPFPLDANDQEPTDWPAGGFATTADDMSRFLLANLQDGRLGDSTILTPATTRLMHTTAFTPMPGSQGIALGFFHQDRNGHEVLNHDGDLTGFHSDLELLPNDHVGLFLAVNSDGAGSPLSAAVTLRSALFQQFMDRYFPAQTPPAQPPTLKTALRDARAIAGMYRFSRRSADNLMAVVYLAIQVPITANPDGTITTPGLLNLETLRPQTWREVAPHTWQEVHGTARLVMKMSADGRVIEWLPDDVPSGFVLQPTPFWASPGFVLPPLAASAAILLLQSLLWPVTAIVRRRFGRKSALQHQDAVALTMVRASAIAGAAFLAAWLVFAVALSASGAPTSVALDPWLRLIQLIGVVATLAVVTAGLGAWLTARGERSWPIKLWHGLVVGALLALAWFAFAFHLISWSLNY